MSPTQNQPLQSDPMVTPQQAPAASPPPQDPAPNPGPSPEQPTSEYPVQLEISYPNKQSRIMAFFSLPFFLIRLVLLIPQLIVIYFVGIAAFVAAWLNMWVILFTGHSSKSLHTFVVGMLRWNTRESAYLYGLTDKYPPFRLKP